MILNHYQGAVEYMKNINAELVAEQRRPLTRIQSSIIAFLLTGMIITSSLCLALFSRLSFGMYSERSMSWLIHKTQIPWNILIHINARFVLKTYAVSEGRIVLDDSERKRGKNTKKLYGVHKIKDKKCNGYVMGQEFVVLILASSTVTVPIDIQIFRPDPRQHAWKKQDDTLRKQGVPKNKRPPRPLDDPKFPSKERIAAKLISRFRFHHSNIDVRSILFDNGYLTAFLMKHAHCCFPRSQIISRMRRNQHIQVGKRRGIPVEKYFEHRAGRVIELTIRGSVRQKVEIKSCRAFVPSLKKKFHIVAVRYLEDKEYRFLVAMDLSWTADSVCYEFGFRWLIEVVFEDWKLYDGYGRSAFQRGADGVGCGLTLSFLVDGLLLTHPKQLTCATSGQPLRTAGSITREIQKDVFIKFVNDIVYGENPRETLEHFKRFSEILVSERLSDKHMSGREIERNKGSPCCKLN